MTTTMMSRRRASTKALELLAVVQTRMRTRGTNDNNALAALATTSSSRNSAVHTDDGAFGTHRKQHLRAPTRGIDEDTRKRWKKENERGFAARASASYSGPKTRGIRESNGANAFKSRATPKTAKTKEEEEEEERNATGNDRMERRQTSSIVNIPNSLSLARAISGPFISYMVVQDPGIYSTELVLTSIALAGVSDYLDGYLARRWNQTSNFGSFFDAAADKIFVSSISVGMAVSGKLPAWMIGVFVFRDCGFLASGFWRRANALKFEKLTWRQYFAIDDVNREDERENKRTESGSSNSNESARVENSDWQAFNSTEKWEPLYVGKVATALQMGLLTVACGQTLDHIPLLFDTYEAQKHAASALVENFGYITFAATTYATAEYAKAYFSHPGWKERKQLRDERREERREHIRASVQDIRNSAKMKYASLKQTSKEKMERVDEMRRVKANTQSRQQRAPTASAD